MYNTPKRFPAPCRFFTQGNCRAGKECHFAHILPIQGVPSKNSHLILIGDAVEDSIQDLNSIQKAIRNIEIEQLKKYQSAIQETKQHEDNTTIEILLPLENRDSIKVYLIIPNNYPDIHCTLQIHCEDMTEKRKKEILSAFEDHEWHQMKHKTIVQQLEWLINYFDSL
ncbi:hypothetical protein BDB01DRAFT_256565 [Pilobolus umbonatus]|nr:hypothetical protein BDB01DRAFT_256565 [Pilobolus umbonatus]